MQLIQKHIISISVVAVFAILGYFVVQNNTPSQSDGIKINTISQSGIETDTGKRLETVANSETQWGMSPFGSGKPLTEEEKKPIFQKPNIDWKSRSVTLSDGRTLYYEFGKGNPAGVAMSLGQIDAMTKTCENDISLAEKGICDAESGNMSYMTSEIERHLLLALSDPNWSKLATECENSFRATEGLDALANARNDLSYLIFDRVFEPGFLDIERFISVDPTTGLKILNNNLTISLAKFVMNGMYDGASRGESQLNPYGDCVDRYGKNIVLHLVATTNLYMRPLQSVE